ncbi:MAG TPA: DHHA1 domain-containing protein, partial [Thermoanaerobaculia bacterium]
ERQALEAAVIESAETAVATMGEVPPILVVWGEGWHRGVVGLCAGRLAQKYNRPVLAVARDGGDCVGSGRSIDGIDLHGALSAVADLFTRFGGHTHACGFSLAAENLEPLRDRLVAQLSATDPARFRRRVAIDGAVTLGQLDGRFAGDHALLEPFGQENRHPTFLARGVAVESSREFSPGCFRLLVRQGSERAAAILWRSASRALAGAVGAGRTVDLLFRLEPDRFDGHRLEVVDAADAGDAPIVEPPR